MSNHRGSTNKSHRVTLPSAIEGVRWTRRQAAPGGTAGLEVRTRFVGNGAPLKIQLLDARGRSHGSFRDQIAGNRLWAEIAVPEKAGQALVADVRLPKHGLQQVSPALAITPPVTVKNAKWSQAEVRRGDVLTLSADAYGVVPDGARARVTIFEHDADGAPGSRLTRFPARVEGKKIEVRWAFQYHEDVGTLPTQAALDRRTAETGIDHGRYRPPEYVFRVEVWGGAAASGLLAFKDTVDIQLVRAGKELTCYAGLEYVLHGPDGSQQKGQLDGDGCALVEDVLPGPYRIAFPELARAEPAGEAPASRASGRKKHDLRVKPEGKADVRISSGKRHLVQHRVPEFAFST